MPDSDRDLTPPTRPKSYLHDWEEMRAEQPVVRRLVVPGGWLYSLESSRTEHADKPPQIYWHPPAFVPGPATSRAMHLTAPVVVSMEPEPVHREVKTSRVTRIRYGIAGVLERLRDRVLEPGDRDIDKGW